jgi:hypothetical protein
MNEFVLCISNKGNAASLIVGKVYRLMPDEEAARHEMVRVLDEDTSEPEGYLYPNRMFVRIDLPENAERALLEASRWPSP